MQRPTVVAARAFSLSFRCGAAKVSLHPCLQWSLVQWINP
jgi:hypothetical protein